MVNSRRKGASFERDIAARFRGLYPDACRGLGQARDGTVAPDVEGTPYWIECKIGKRPNPFKALEQATRNTDGPPALTICRVNRGPVVVSLHFKDFLELLEKATK